MIVTMGMGTEQGGGTNIYYLEESIALELSSEESMDIDTSTDIEVSSDLESDIIIMTEED